MALLCLGTPHLYGSKTDDALAAALAQNKAQALTIAALTRATAKANSDAAARAITATQQRDSISAATDANVANVAQSVSDQKDTSVRVEAKTDAAVASATAAKSSADAATSASDRNTMLIALFGALGLIGPAWFKYRSDVNATATAVALAAQVEAHQAEVVGKLDKVATQTNGVMDRVAQLATAAGHAQGVVDANNEAGRVGD